MTDDIAGLGPLPSGGLDAESFFLSLAGVGETREQCIRLLAVQIKKYTGGKSSSIPAETAQELMSSVFYTLGIALKAVPDPAGALASVPLSELFAEGQRLIRLRLSRARSLHRQLLASLFQTENVFYNSTAREGLDGFFRLYRPQFFAHHTHINADYPLFSPPGELRGIEFIERYIRGFVWENSFCRMFSPERVQLLLLGACPDYRYTPMNIFEPVLAAALCCRLTGRQPESLCYAPDELWRILSGRDAGETELLLRRALADIPCPQGLRRFAGACLPRLAANIYSAGLLGRIEAAVPVPLHQETDGNVYFLSGERLSSGDYEALLKTLMRSPDGDIPRIILERIRSITDLIDILTDCPPAEPVIARLLAALPMEVCAALYSAFGMQAGEGPVTQCLERLRAGLSPDAALRFDRLSSQARFST